MAAGLGFKTFTTGEVLTAADTNGYLMQGILVFASAAARNSAITSPQEGQACYLKDTNEVLTYSGSAWVAVGASVPASLQYAAGKNKFINGAFDNWQRGTSFASVADATYTADRFAIFYDGSGATRTVSRQTFTPGTAPVAGYEGQFFYRMDQTVAGTGASYNYPIMQKIEDVRTFAGQSVTFSFWAKADAARTVTVEIDQLFGSGGSAGVVALTSGNLSVTTAWQRFTVSGTLPSVSGKTIGTGSSLNVFVMAPLNTVQIFDTWGWQIEEGSTVTDFQTATGTLQGELAACQRYYQKSYAQATAPATNSAGGYITLKTSSNTIATAEGYGSVFLPVTMRTAPTVTIRPFTTASNTGRVSSGIGTDLAASSGNAVAINETKFSVNNNTGGTLTTAELVVIFHYEASSEL
jgi:hypothetical protein